MRKDSEPLNSRVNEESSGQMGFLGKIPSKQLTDNIRNYRKLFNHVCRSRVNDCFWINGGISSALVKGGEKGKKNHVFYKLGFNEK